MSLFIATNARKSFLRFVLKSLTELTAWPPRSSISRSLKILRMSQRSYFAWTTNRDSGSFSLFSDSSSSILAL